MTDTLHTIGFTRKSASEFFGALQSAGVKTVVDVRVNNTSQLAGFTKKDDLAFFLHEVLGVRYIHELSLAPTQELVKSYRGKQIDGDEFSARYLDLLESRGVRDQVDESDYRSHTILLCSEPDAAHCHRRIAAEYINASWGGFKSSTFSQSPNLRDQMCGK